MLRLAQYLLLLITILPQVAWAYIPTRITPADVRTVTVVSEPEVQRTYFGELSDFPHTYEFSSAEPFLFKAVLGVPDIETAKDNISGIIVRKEAQGVVTEVARLRANAVHWYRVREPVAQNIYRMGPGIETTLEPGTYRLEVHTPDNTEKYILTIGHIPQHEDRSYKEKMTLVLDTKDFFNVSPITALASPVFYRPLVLLVIGIAVVAYLVRIKRRISV